MAAHVLCLDLGTTGVRALCVDAGGTVRGRAYERLQVRLPAPDRVEQDALEFARSSRLVIDAARAQAQVSAHDVVALGLVCQRSSALAWDRVTGQPLAPVIGWQDRRTLERVEALRAMGLPLNTLASCTKFEWLLTLPDVAQAAREQRLCLGTPDVWLGYWLSGGHSFVTDVSNAGATGLLDAGAGDWWSDALALFGLQREWLPEVVATNAAAGNTDPERAGGAWLLAARCGDQQAACFAQQVRQPGTAKLTLGTSAMLDVCTGDVPSAAPAGGYDLPLWQLQAGTGVAESRFCHEGTVITAGAAVEWLLQLGLLPAVEQLDALAGRGAPGVTFVPALAGLGTPWMQDSARGAWLGLGLGTDSAALVRAVLDGIAQRCADLMDTLKVGDGLQVDGGLGQSDWLLQRLADLSGRTVRRAAEVETTALGGAALAASCPDAGLAAMPLPASARSWTPTLGHEERRVLRARWQQQVEALVALSKPDS